MWSISVALLSVILVGITITGVKLLTIKLSKYALVSWWQWNFFKINIYVSSNKAGQLATQNLS